MTITGGRPRTRTLRSFVVRALVPRAAVFGVVATMAVLGHAIAVDPSAHVTALPAAPAAESGPASSWTFDDLAAFPGCVASSAWPAGVPAGYVVVHGVEDGTHLKVAFGHAWRVNHDADRSNDLWVVGVCHDQP